MIARLSHVFPLRIFNKLCSDVMVVALLYFLYRFLLSEHQGE